MKELKLSCNGGENVMWYYPFENMSTMSCKVNPAISSLDVYLREMKAYVPFKTNANVQTALKSGNYPKFIIKWMAKQTYIHPTKYYSTIKRHEHDVCHNMGKSQIHYAE